MQIVYSPNCKWRGKPCERKINQSIIWEVLLKNNIKAKKGDTYAKVGQNLPSLFFLFASMFSREMAKNTQKNNKIGSYF